MYRLREVFLDVETCGDIDDVGSLRVVAFAALLVYRDGGERLVLHSCKHGGVLEECERVLLERLLELLEWCARDKCTLYTFNGLRFDLPLLAYRMVSTSLLDWSAAWRLHRSLYTVDLRQAALPLTGFKLKGSTLEQLAERLLGEEGTPPGRTIVRDCAELGGDTVQALEERCRAEVELMRRVRDALLEHSQRIA